MHTAEPPAAQPEPAWTSARTTRTRTGLTALCLAGLLGACAERGDLGRPQASFWNSTILPTAGSWAALARNEPVSMFHLTDDEMELRARSWNFIMPAHERSWFDTQVQELARTRIIPASEQSVDPSAYHRALTGEAFRSPVSRYNRLHDDIQSDRALIVAFINVAGKVTQADRIRLKALAHSSHIPWENAAEADARVAENEGLVLWVCERVRYRTRSFRYTLDNLVVEMPGNAAIRSERALLGLEDQAAMLTSICGAGPFVAEPTPKGLKVVVKYRG